MATITVSYDGVELILSDNGHTNASRSEQIIWHPGTGVHSITSVTKKTSSPKTTEEFWANPPQQNGVNFKGTINSSAEGAWDYDITCNVGTQQNPVFKSKDPRIQVFSR
ncbi:hypothetical protein [Mariniphaga sp.]|uniref:hypothetical protein n=1 Tax=Mariniphaga sp. TaxID=1954475 RepID=UPI0035638E88